MILLGSAYAASAVSTLPNDELSLMPSLLLSAWVFGFILNVSVTVAIAWRLWWMGRIMTSLTTTRADRYASLIKVVVESGAISAVVSTAVVALYADPTTALTGLDVASQLVVCVQSSFLSFVH
jgi:hypothetical protein